MLRYAIAFWLALAPAWADGMAVPGVPAAGQDVAAFNYPPSAGGGGGNDAATTAWVAQVVTRGGTVSGTQTTNVNNLVVCLKGGGTNLFTISDRLYLEASENITQATTDLINPSSTQATSTGTFNAIGGTPPFGISGDGSTTFADTKWAPSTGVNYTQNNATWMMYNGTSADVGNNSYGAFSAAGTNALILRIASATIGLFAVNETGGAGYTIANSKGIFITTRTGAAATQTWRNGTSLGTAVGTSTGLTTATVYMAGGVNNNGGGLAAGGTDVFGAFGALASLNSTQVTQYNTCIQNYMTAVGNT